MTAIPFEKFFTNSNKFPPKKHLPNGMRLIIIINTAANTDPHAMYVCICSAVTERQIRACAQGGATTMQDLREKLCVADNCGKCARHAKTILREVHGTPAAAPVTEAVVSEVILNRAVA